MAHHYTPEQLASFPWIVSCDTLKADDLLVKFWSAAESCAVLADRPQLLNPGTLASLTKLVGEDSSESDWDDAEASETLQELIDTLNDAAPCGFYFGSSEGDGAAFGFWVIEDWADALETLDLGDDDPSGWAELISRLALDGIEPDTIEDAYQGRAEGYSEEHAGRSYAEELAYETNAAGVDWGGQTPWPLGCIDWDAAWRELELGDGYRLHDIGGGEWLVFRSV